MYTNGSLDQFKITRQIPSRTTPIANVFSRILFSCSRIALSANTMMRFVLRSIEITDISAPSELTDQR